MTKHTECTTGSIVADDICGTTRSIKIGWFVCQSATVGMSPRREQEGVGATIDCIDALHPSPRGSATAK